jgi:hypothetical protein
MMNHDGWMGGWLGSGMALWWLAGAGVVVLLVQEGSNRIS